MQGLKLAREFYQVCQPILRAELAGIIDTAAVGLVGEGSECFGCDDAHSQDHDFGPAFCLWLPREVLLAEQPRIEAAFAKLPHEFQGFASRLAPQSRQGRVGPLPIEDFYAFLRGSTMPRPPGRNGWPFPNTSLRHAPMARFLRIRAARLRAGAQPCWPATRAMCCLKK